MEKETVAIIRGNIANLMGLRNISSMYALSVQAKVADKTVSNLMADDVISNPTVKVLTSLARVLRVEPWMLLVEDFPFEQIKGKPLKQIHGPAYVVADAMEHETHVVQLLMMEAVSHALRGIDPKRSNYIKEEQASYLIDTKQESR